MSKGALHIHSTYSDGDFTLAELREIFVRAGCRFVCITDHADSFDTARLDAYIAECADRSDDRFEFIAGLEYTCLNRMHVLGYGTTVLIDSADPQEVFRQIAASGGVAVIAHPRDESFEWIRTFETLPNGIEAWNTKYDGRYAPRPATFGLLAELRVRRPGLTAFYGQDLHWRTQYRGIFVEVGCAAADRTSVLGALRRGDYVGIKDDLRLRASGQIPEDVLAHFAHVHERSQRLRRLVKRVKRWADQLGIAVPARMKGQLRRMF